MPLCSLTLLDIGRKFCNAGWQPTSGQVIKLHINIYMEINGGCQYPASGQPSPELRGLRGGDLCTFPDLNSPTAGIFSHYTSPARPAPQHRGTAINSTFSA